MNAAADPAPLRIEAAYFDGRSSKRHAVVIEAQAGQLKIVGAFGERIVAWRDVSIAEVVGSAPRRIDLPHGAHCEIGDHRAFAEWMRHAPIMPSIVETVQQRWRWVLAALAGTVAFLVAGYLWGLPLAASALAPHIPRSWMQSISEQALQSLDSGMLSASALPEQRRQHIRDRVAALARESGSGSYRLLFRSARKTANAFALPNGDIVILDGLVTLTDDDDEIAAVIAHELGHVVHRHGVRQLIQASVVSALVGYYFGDVSSIATGLATLTLESRYSREFETEADAYAADLLRARGMNPALLADMLERMEKQDPQHGGSDVLSSHPETAQRILMLRKKPDA